MAEVLNYDGITKLNLDPNRILESALKLNLTSSVVIGWENGEFYFASSLADGGEVLWLLELAKKKLLEIGDK